MATSKAGRKHQHERELIEYAKKLVLPESVASLADWLRAEYPESCSVVLPELRKIYTEAKKRRQRDTRKLFFE